MPHRIWCPWYSLRHSLPSREVLKSVISKHLRTPARDGHKNWIPRSLVIEVVLDVDNDNDEARTRPLSIKEIHSSFLPPLAPPGHSPSLLWITESHPSHPTSQNKNHSSWPSHVYHWFLSKWIDFFKSKEAHLHPHTFPQTIDRSTWPTPKSKSWLLWTPRNPSKICPCTTYRHEKLTVYLIYCKWWSYLATFGFNSMTLHHLLR